MEDVKDVTADSSSALGDAIASSPEALEAPIDTQTPPAKEEGVSQEEGKIPYSRFKEKVDEANWYKQQLEIRLQREQQLQQPIQQPQAQQELGNTPEEREFWALQRKIANEEARKVSQEQLRSIQPTIDAGRSELAQLKVQQFRNAHTDVKPDSPEEVAIAQKIGMGYLPEDAYRAVMWDKKVVNTEREVKQQLKQTIDAKKLANVEQKSIPSGSLSPTKSNLTLRQRIEQNAKDLEF